MQRTLTFAVFALLLTTGTVAAAVQQGTRPGSPALAPDRPVAVLEGVADHGRVSGTLATSTTLQIEDPELVCSFSVTCNADGTMDISTEGCTPSVHTRILKWAIDICST